MTGASGGPWPAADERAVEEFRSSSSRLLAVVWWALSACALADIAIRGRDHLALTVALVILASDLLLWLGAWRPRVQLFHDHLVLRGSLRDRSLTLASVTSATANGPLLLWVGTRRFSSPVVGSSVRQRRRAARQTAAVPSGSLFGGGRRGVVAPSVGFDDSRLDPATRDALVGRTPGAYAAERITAEADRLRRTARLSSEQAVAALQTRARWVRVPVAATALVLLVLVVVVLL